MVSRKVKSVVNPLWWKERRRNAIMMTIVFSGRIMNAVHATTAASMMASSMHTAFSRVYTFPQDWPISLHGCEGSHCSADERTAPNAHSAVAIMMP
jgi:hypothetical protein